MLAKEIYRLAKEIKKLALAINSFEKKWDKLEKEWSSLRSLSSYVVLPLYVFCGGLIWYQVIQGFMN